ncbi:MAG: transglycosylase domain-containing protein [Victivallales bacterium]|nr:transglycosylase domain-containing protein [Victivallales bacterium]
MTSRKNTKYRIVRRVFLGLLAGVLAWIALWSLLPLCVENPLDELARQTPVRLYLDANGDVLRVERTYDWQWREPVPLAEISPHFVQAVLSTEDIRFHRHSGVDIGAAFRAFAENLTSGKVISGASTITMQLVALPRAGRRKNWREKILQVLQARRMEQLASKEQILAEYLNRIPFGGKIYGVQAASRYYFGKTAKELTMAEAALLAGLPQRPNALRPDRHPERAAKRQSLILDMMERHGTIGRGEAARLAGEPLAYRDFSTPSWYRRHYDLTHEMELRRARNESCGALLVRTSLLPHLHHLIWERLRAQVALLTDVEDAAAVLVDNRSMGVLAMVGTLDFHRPGNGQVNAATAIRNAGSTLKPFIYAEAIAGGLIAEETILQDTPLISADYRPANYEGRFSGRVSAADALSRSLNLPAIRLLAELGIDRTLDIFDSLRLLHGNRALLRQDKGLTLALGTGGHTLLNLTYAYAALARRGVLFRPTFLAGGKESGQQVYPASAAALTAHILRRRPLPGCTLEVAWKTGTSNGLHDAWCLAFTADYTLGVWLGNKSGRASAALVGATAAAPVAGSIFAELYSQREPPDWRDNDRLLVQQRLCAQSGLSPSAACVKYLHGLGAEGIPLRQCRVCGTLQAAPPLAILSPRASTYFQEQSTGVPIPLQATAPNALWYVDGDYLGQVSANIPYLFQKGRHTVQVLTENASATVEFVVTPHRTK